MRQGLADYFNGVFLKAYDRGDFGYEEVEEWDGFIDDCAEGGTKMNEIERAISEIIGTNYGECQCHRETMVQAVEALREQAEREKNRHAQPENEPLVPLKPTNADRIRGMSDEELADWIDSMLNQDREDWDVPGCYNCIFYDPQNKGTHLYSCADCPHEGSHENGLKYGVLAWLRQPVDGKRR